MLYAIMLLSIGFMVACLLMAALAPLIHERAVRLTTQRHLAATPLSVAEMQAEKDGLRADFAMTLRRLEMSAAQAKAQAATQLSEVGRKSAEIHRLKAEVRAMELMTFKLRTRDMTHKTTVRRVAKLMIYLLARIWRQRRRESTPPVVRTAKQFSENYAWLVGDAK